MNRWWRLLDFRIMRASEWWRMPLIGLLISAPISLTTSLFLASYGAQGPYGGFGRLLLAGLAASVPVFVLSGLVFAPVEICLSRQPQRLRPWHAAALRGGVLALTGVFGAFIAYGIVVWALPAPPPYMLLPVLLITYPLDIALVGLIYTLYEQYLHQLEVSTQLTHELRVASGIQQGLFPRQLPRLPGYDLAVRCQPARETGGDFFDFIELSGGRLGVVVADVAGKGMPAALLMANARSTWRAEARLAYNPAETLRRANRSLCRDVNSNSFVTFLYAILDPAERKICFAGAGHPLPLIFKNSEIREVEVYGLPLGLSHDATYDEACISLEPGDTVLLYTDGITEAMGPSRELFGYERLLALLQREGHRAARSLVERTWSAASDFSGASSQADDMTVMVLKALR
jgi:serine phosphatase RsbU (regulator of sigma subunit)